MLTRSFKIGMNAGHIVTPVIHVNQYDHDEQWIFTLVDDNGVVYTPSTGGIVGLKADGNVILNAGTVNSSGQVVINETQQMTAAAGDATYELLLDNSTHGCANFTVRVEPKPGDNASMSASDLSLLQEAIDSTIPANITAAVQDWMDDNLAPSQWVIDNTLSIAGAAADAKKTGDGLAELKTAIDPVYKIEYGINTHVTAWNQGGIIISSGAGNGVVTNIRTDYVELSDDLGGLKSVNGYTFLPFAYSREGNTYTYLGYWREDHFSKATGSPAYYLSELYLRPLKDAGADVIVIVMKNADSTNITPSEGVNLGTLTALPVENAARIDDIEATLETGDRNDANCLTDLVNAQKCISEKWHFGFIDVFNSMGLGSNFIIPGTKNIWSETHTADLTQREIWMSDGVHPFRGDGVTDMYARTIAEQLAMIPPSYKNGVGSTTPTLWNGRTILWLGTSIPAGSDPEAGGGTGATYPSLVGTILGAAVLNIARGSSCVRINASTGEYSGMIFNHFLRAITRTIAECDIIAANWESIKGKIINAPDTLSEAQIEVMKSSSFENLLLPYLNGTQNMPDLFVFDYGHNDVRPKGIDGETDLWIDPSQSLIDNGTLAEDTYMTVNNYANLKTALNNDLSGISDLSAFASKLNRNCYKGASNFIMTLILRYNPYARVVVISDYN